MITTAVMVRSVLLVAAVTAAFTYVESTTGKQICVHSRDVFCTTFIRTCLYLGLREVCLSKEVPIYASPFALWIHVGCWRLRQLTVVAAAWRWWARRKIAKLTFYFLITFQRSTPDEACYIVATQTTGVTLVLINNDQNIHKMEISSRPNRLSNVITLVCFRALLRVLYLFQMQKSIGRRTSWCTLSTIP